MLASEDHPSVMKFLLLNGARTDLRNDEGNTAAEEALAQADGFARMDESKRVKAELRKAQIIRKFRSRAKR